MEWKDDVKFQQKKKQKNDRSDYEKGFVVKTYQVDVAEKEKVIIVLQQDIVRIVQDRDGNVYPEQFQELINKGILKENKN